MKYQINKLFYALSLLLFSLVMGTLGFILLEGYDFGDAFYMAVITLSTVGFTEVKELSSPGRLFTSIYILMNLGILTYAVSVLAAYLFEGKLRLIYKNYMVDLGISKLKNHVIICGYGITGRQAQRELEKIGKPVVVLEKEARVFKNIPENASFHMLEGDATIDSKLKLAGIERAAVIMITTSSDADNVFITLTARELQPNIKIYSRASAIETEKKLFRAGADQVINSARHGGSYMAQMVSNPVVIEFLNMLTGETKQQYHLKTLGYQELKPSFQNKSLRALNISEITGCTVVGVKDDIKGLIPSPPPDTFIGEEDTIILLGDDEQLGKMLQHFT